MERKLIYFVIVLFSFLLLLRFAYGFTHLANYQNNQAVSFTTTLFSEPSQKGNFQTLLVVLPAKQQFGFGDKINVVLPLSPQYYYGQKILVSGKVESRMIANGQIVKSIYLPKVEVVKNQDNFLLGFVANIRKKFVLLFNESLPSPSAQLLLGIVFGIKQQMPQQFTIYFQNTGVLHVIAASGMNITMVASFLLAIFGRLFKRQYALVLGITGIFLYTMLAGFQPSIVRAAIMGSLLSFAQLFGRQNYSLYSLFITAWIMLMFDPLLINDLGFQLSFSSTLGILFISPLIKIHHVFGFISEDFRTTFSSQLASLPILLMSFGQYGLVSLLVNLLVLWTIPPLMIIGGLAAIIGLFVPELGSLILQLSLPILVYFESIVAYFGSLQLLYVATSIPTVTYFGYYCLLVSAILLARKQKNFMQ